MLHGIKTKLGEIGGKSPKSNTGNYLITQYMELMNSCSPQSCVLLACLLYPGGMTGEVCYMCHWREFSLYVSSPQGWGEHLLWGWTAIGFTLAVSEAICAKGRQQGCLSYTWGLPGLVAREDPSFLLFLEFSALLFHLCYLLTTNLPVKFIEPASFVFDADSNLGVLEEVLLVCTQKPISSWRFSD